LRASMGQILAHPETRILSDNWSTKRWPWGVLPAR